ncbi:MAG TPA: serine hydrolase domain-containing protein [Myxococcales bacterium]
MRRWVLPCFWCSLFLGCFSGRQLVPPAARTADAPPPAPERLAADTPRATPGGATFTAPAGWSLVTREACVVLDPPELDSHVAVVDVRAKDADSAVAAAWKLYRPEMSRPLKLATDRPARNGWDQRRVYQYETSPNERAFVQAVAQRAGEAWTVLLIDASEPTFEKRAAPVSLIANSLRPRGYQRESFAGRTARSLDEGRVAEMKAFLETGMRDLRVPGVAFSLIQDGKVVYEGGLGVRELGKPERIDANTLFIAASNTKALTTLLLARLVDAGKLRWDQPVTEVYPPFRLGDADTTSRVLIRHLICACTGLPRQDLEWIFEFAKATPESSMALLATMQPTSKFGEVFQYSNLLAAAAGFVGGHLLYPDRELGAAYDEAMRSQIFAPLGMTATTFDYALAQQGNHARPHGLDIDGNAAMAKMDLNYAAIPVRPAGAMWTSAHDLSKYILLELASGKLPEGTRLVSAESLRARRAPQILLGADQTYGMGLMEDRTWGVPVVHHGGDLAGYHSDMIFLPDHGVGAVLLTNGDDGYRMRRPFLRRLLELLFDGKPEAAEDMEASARQSRAQIAKERERLTVPAAAEPAGKLARRYRNASLGELAVRREGGATVFDFGEWKSEVASRRNDDGTLSFVTIEPALLGFELVVADRDGKRRLIVRDGQHEYVFEEAG